MEMLDSFNLVTIPEIVNLSLFYLWHTGLGMFRMEGQGRGMGMGRDSICQQVLFKNRFQLIVYCLKTPKFVVTTN